jgi:hypothetical protein
MTPSVYNGIQFEDLDSHGFDDDSFEHDEHDIPLWTDTATVELNSMGIILENRNSKSART